MAPRSNVVRRMGVKKCDLCGKCGSERNQLTRHHADGNKNNHKPENLMVLHRILCHTFGDYITQLLSSTGYRATPSDITHAWKLLHASDWLYRLIRPGA